MSETRELKTRGRAALHNRTTAVTTFSKHGLPGGIIFGSAALLCVGQAADKAAPQGLYLSHVYRVTVIAAS